MTVAPPDLAEVMEHYGTLVNTAIQGNQRVPCPLHEDQTPSCSVNLGKQVWRCFSCDGKGSSWQLIMEKEGTDFNGARRIASSNGWRAGDTGGSDEPVRSGYRRRGGGMAGRPGKRAGGRDGSFRPTWRS